jgi:hypothetical protein
MRVSQKDPDDFLASVERQLGTLQWASVAGYGEDVLVLDDKKIVVGSTKECKVFLPETGEIRYYAAFALDDPNDH